MNGWPNRLAAAALAALTAAACGDSGPQVPTERSNLVLITVSSLRADHLGIYGYPRNISPNLDLFGASGAVFLEALTPWPETGRAAAALLTGVDPSRSTRGEPARLIEGATLAARLREHGYRTLAAVSHPALAAELGFGSGFDEFREHWGDPATATDRVREFGIGTLVDATGDAPLFLWLHFAAPARPHQPPEDDLNAVRSDTMTPAGPQFRGGPQPTAAVAPGAGYGELADSYDASIRSVDRAAGAVLTSLASGPLGGQTLFVVAGLHGESLGEHGPPFESPRTLFRETLEVPLLVGWPGGDGTRVPAETRFGSAVGLGDVGPTALELIGVPLPDTPRLGTIGKSLVPALLGDDPRPHRRLYAQSERGLFGVYNGRLRMLRIPVPGQEAPLYALFNLVRDPNEAENVYEQARFSMEPLKAQLETRRIQTVAWQQENEGGGAPDPDISEELGAALEGRGYR
ncbi:MAG: sulfatase-like hydrolase/transferase [Acidobacteria bacterium]|nr:sulfatase-like hydrolase/transferase [Acidobacteriota bacterium]MYA47181.1 sulfatase-like hydrolase/transferase [Acidobacteriota bacterium]MYH22074.1 sulfatase-like hydrolase/transferase [Acidobacteriota bacterium]MYI37530.1 sulfatase-like hydrolase/transferase [Acidobacteriota bacterium]MYK80888.1 sulfatase-like hydrolase/transferase [Acidobacteriota bacterium]